MKLTPTHISSLVQKRPSEIEQIDLSSQGIDEIEDISFCVNLHKLNLSNNALTAGDPISGLCYTTEITWLNLSKNLFENFDGLQYLFKLSVLNLSHNHITHLSSHLLQLKNLKALILNHNSIAQVENINHLKLLNTLVLSHNRIELFPKLPGLKSLTKLSISHNHLRTFPDLSCNSNLKELRLNDNRIASIADNLHLFSSLEILDLGNNVIKAWSEIDKLASLIHLLNLNLKGNPITKEDGYREKVLKLIPTLRVLDGIRFDPKFLTRKRKRLERPMDLTSSEHKQASSLKHASNTISRNHIKFVD